MTTAVQEPMLKYHPLIIWNLIPRGRHRLVGSLTGVGASKSVTGASQGALSTNGNRARSVLAKARLTERPTRRPGKKLAQSDPVVPHGWPIARRIKGTPGITG